MTQGRSTLVNLKAKRDTKSQFISQAASTLDNHVRGWIMKSGGYKDDGLSVKFVVPSLSVNEQIGETMEIRYLSS